MREARFPISSRAAGPGASRRAMSRSALASRTFAAAWSPRAILSCASAAWRVFTRDAGFLLTAPERADGFAAGAGGLSWHRATRGITVARNEAMIQGAIRRGAVGASSWDEPLRGRRSAPKERSRIIRSGEMLVRPLRIVRLLSRAGQARVGREKTKAARRPRASRGGRAAGSSGCRRRPARGGRGVVLRGASPRSGYSTMWPWGRT